MAKYLYYICACCFLFLFSRCGKGKSESEEIPFNPYVEAFTSGTISRYTPVYLIFNQEIAVDRMEPDQLRDLVKIKPETVGEFAFENNRTIVFKPSKSFERDTRYEVKADLSEWFDTERKDKYFSFRFSTQPLLLRANLQSVDINRKNENGYDIVCSVFTPDREIPETMPAENMTVTAQWEIDRYTITFDTAGGSEIAPITQDYGTHITAPADPTREGYTFIGWDMEIPTTMPAENITLKAKWKDIEKPTGEIIIGTNKWREFLNTLTFGLFFKDTQEVTINASDNSGTVFISYLVTDRDLSETELGSLVYRAYEEPFRIDPNGEYIVYAMLVDESLNITYLRSDRVTLDNVRPVISGIEDGKTYCAAQTVTVDEKYVDTVTVNGTAVTLDENNSFTLAPADGEQRIVVTDKAGNTAEMTVTVNNGHTYGEWVSNGDGTHTRQCTVDGCNGLETKDCSGGKATCKDKAVCEVCGKAYGELDPKNHTALKHIPAKAATEDAEGNIEYWYCEGCDKYYSDKYGTKEIAKADTVTAKLPKSTPTGDTSNLMLWIALLLASGGAVIGAAVVSKKKKHSAE